MTSSTAPYATMNDSPKFEKRAGEVKAPWFKEPASAKSMRIKDPVPYITCNAKSAPYATSQNVPKAAEQSAPLPETSVEQQPRPYSTGSRSPQEKKFSTPYGTSNDVVRPRAKTDLAKVHQAPWDRSDRKLDHRSVQPNASNVHSAPWDRSNVHRSGIKVQPKSPGGEVASNQTSPTVAPFATDSKRG